MNQRDQALQWAAQYLTAYTKSSILNHQEVVQTSYSIVHRIETTEGVVYLKQVPENLFVEPKMLAFLHEQGCKNIPELLAENSDLHCFLMTSCGDDSLRRLFKGKVDLKKLKLGILNYTNIQRLLENKTRDLLLLGVPDWQLDKFASLYYKLIEQENLLLDDGLTKKEVDRLRQHYPTCIKLCEDLLEFKIPETVSHCDFHENNMLLDRETGAINIIDWGESVIAHPFFSLNSCLWNIVHFNNINKTDPMYYDLQSHCISPWLDLYDKKKLLKAFSLADRLNGVYAALAYERLYIVTEDQPKKVQQEHPGSIAGCLRTFLSSMSPTE